MNSAQRINRVGSDLTRPHSLRHQRSIKQTVVLYSPLLVGVALLMADLVLRDAGIAARFSVGAVRPFRFRRTAQAGTHKLLAGVAGHAACLRVAILHSLLLRGELGARWCHQRGDHSDGDQISSHPASLSRALRRTGS